MPLEGYVVIATILFMITALILELSRPGLILFCVVVFFMALGYISSNELLAGFSNRGMLTVAVLFLVSEGVRRSGILEKLARWVLPQKRYAMSRLLLLIMVPISALSAFLNNTPVVIIFGPVIKKWAEKMNLSPSKFLIPLSYATIFGGVCTLIGTSTNLVVDGLMFDNGFKGFSMFELGKIGFFIALAGWLYMAFIGHFLLPGGKQKFKKPYLQTKEYYFNVLVKRNSKVIGEVVKNGEVGFLKDSKIIAIERNDAFIKTTNTPFVLKENDNLLVVGHEDTIDTVTNNSGLELVGTEDISRTLKKKELHRIEVVLAPRFQGIGKTIDEFDFMNHYQAVFIALHRNGEQISSNLNDVRLKPGDTIVMLASEEFIEMYSQSKIFFLVTSKGEVEKPVKTYKMGWAIASVVLMVLGVTFSQYLPEIGGLKPDMFYFASIAAVILTITGLLPGNRYTKVISWDVLITIACAFGISKALLNTEAADHIAQTAIKSVQNLGPRAVLAVIYLFTMLFTEVITNNAAAAIIFPIALTAASKMGVDPRPFFVAICMAASCSFSTPIGYQTNLIVQALGKYRFRDYLRTGLPMNIIAFILSILIIPLFWGF